MYATGLSCIRVGLAGWSRLGLARAGWLRAAEDWCLGTGVEAWGPGGW